MNPLSAESCTGGRIAVVGADSLTGQRVRDALALRRLAGARVSLFGVTGGEVVLSEYAGEPRIVQEPDPEEVARHQVIFLCEALAAVGPILAAAPAESVIVDFTGSAPPDGPWKVVGVPHPIALVLAELLQPLQEACGILLATATVLRPAADFGQPGLDELRDQTVRLLGLASPPRSVFGRQLAFNLIPQGLVPGEPTDLDRRIAGDASRLMGWSESRLAVSLVVVPVFHGHGVSLRVEPERPFDLAGVLAALRRSETVQAPSLRTAPTPVQAGGGRRIQVARITDDGLGGFWIWAVAGEADAAAAEKAVGLAASLADL